MAERETASEQFSRILHLLAVATRADGASLEELATVLEVPEARVLRDLQEVYTRAFYHPAGSGEDTQVLIEAGRVNVWTKGEFRRPARLEPGEALALSLGLRVLAAESVAPRRERILSLAGRLEGLLGDSPAEGLAGVELEPKPSEEFEVRAAMLAAARERRRCLIGYLKPRAASVDSREIEPYVVVAAGGWWYVLARCCRGDSVKAFRIDRIVEVVAGEESFEIPDGFEPGEHLSGGHVFRADEEIAVTVRYSPRIARWLTERGEAEPLDDGSVLVAHRVADPRWLVRHVLQYGPDAEVVEPANFRRLVLESVRRISAHAG